MREYIALTRLTRSDAAHDDYLPGERIMLDDARAAVLLGVGAIAPADGDSAQQDAQDLLSGDNNEEVSDGTDNFAGV